MLLKPLNDALNLLAIVGRRKPGDIRLLLCVARLFTPSLAWPVNSSREGETCEKQVAMIAQKIMNANQTQDQGGRLVSLSNSRAPTLWTLLRYHFKQAPLNQILTRRSLIVSVPPRLKPRLQRFNLTRDAFGAGNTNFILESFAIQIKQRVFISFNSTAVMTLEC